MPAKPPRPSEVIDVEWWPVDSGRAPSGRRAAPPPAAGSRAAAGRALLLEVLADVATRGDLSRRTTLRVVAATVDAFAETPLGRKLRR